MIEDNNASTLIKDEPQFGCVKCGRAFKSAPALRMHKIRMHSDKGWDTSKNFQNKHRGRGRNQTDEERLTQRRAYQRTLRERYYSEGRNSHGKKMPPGWKPRKSKVPLSRTPEYVRQYQRRYYAKRNQEAQLDTQVTSTTPDMTGEAARAILVAASVLRAVTVGMKITK